MRALHVDRGEARRRAGATGSSQHVDLPLAPPTRLHLADAGDALDLPAHLLVGELGDLADRLVGARQRDEQDGRGVRVELADDRRVDALGQVGQDGVDVVAHLLRGDVDVLLEVEADDDLRDALGSRSSAARRCR